MEYWKEGQLKFLNLVLRRWEKIFLHNNHLELTWRCIMQSVCVFPVGELQLLISCFGFKRRQATQVNVIYTYIIETTLLRDRNRTENRERVLVITCTEPEYAVV